MLKLFIIIIIVILGALINSFIIPSNFQYVFGYFVGSFTSIIIFAWRN